MTDNYEKLANAIILQAVDDYRKSLHTLLLYPHDQDARNKKASTLRFFRSSWFNVLTNLGSETLIGRLNKEVRA